MATLFNCNNDSFIDFVKKHTQNLSKDNSYKFYAMTCYFKQDATKELAELIHAILENSLCEFHLLIDINEYCKEFCKELLDRDSFIAHLATITKLSSKNISITPISPSPKPLFHAKAYALINCDHSSEAYYQGFGIITSANLSNGGIRENIEIGHIFDDNNSLRDFYNIFMNLKNNYTIPEQELEERLQKQREFVKKQEECKKVVNLLSFGRFYHKWEQEHQIDLRFIIKLSKDAKERIKNQGNDNEVSTILKEKGFDQKKKQNNPTKKPIDIKNFFKLFPEVIPDDILGTSSIDTLLGKWIPNQISSLIEKEVDEKTNTYIKILQKHLEENLDHYLKELDSIIEEFRHKNIIDWNDEDNRKATERWKDKIIKISQDENLLKLLLWKYQIIPISLNSIQDPDLILTLYDRLHDLYQPNINRKGKVGKIFSDNSENNYEEINSDSFNGIYKEVEHKLNDNRLGDLSKKDNQGKYFCAIVKPENNIVTGIFIRLQESDFKETKFIFYKTKAHKEKNIKEIFLVENLVTFKIIESKDESILHKFGFI
ncbi:MAG: hypothetical protein WBA52_10210 [Dolichospermum sp.]